MRWKHFKARNQKCNKNKHIKALNPKCDKINVNDNLSNYTNADQSGESIGWTAGTNGMLINASTILHGK